MAHVATIKLIYTTYTKYKYLTKDVQYVQNFQFAHVESLNFPGDGVQCPVWRGANSED